MSQEKRSEDFCVWINMSRAYCGAHLFDSVQRGSYGDDWHDNDGHSIVVVLISTPQNHTEQLEDVKRVQDLKEETGAKTVRGKNSQDFKGDYLCKLSLPSKKYNQSILLVGDGHLNKSHSFSLYHRFYNISMKYTLHIVLLFSKCC